MKLPFLITLVCFMLSGVSQNEVDSLISEKANPDSIQQPNWKFQQKNDLHLEILGAAGLYSINYERLLINTHRSKTLVSVGISFIGINSWKGFVIPVSLNELISFKQHHIELGIGGSPNFVVSNDFGANWDQFVFTRIGYRHQKPNGKFVFRAGVLPIVYPDLGLWAGISIGHSF